MQDEKEHEKWLKIFFEGNFLIPGWNDRKKEILSAVIRKKADAERLLDQLGELIGREWARDNSVRRISTEDVRRWGQDIVRAKRLSEEEILEKLGVIRNEVLGRLG